MFILSGRSCSITMVKGKNQETIKVRSAWVGKISRVKMGKWGAEPLVCWRNPVHPLQISPWQLSDIRTPGRSLWRLLHVQESREESCTFGWGWMCPCALWLPELLQMRNSSRTNVCSWFLSLRHVVTCPGAH